MVCNSIPGHPLGFSPSVSGLPNFGMLDRSPCSAVSAKKSGFHKREFWNSQSAVSNTRVPEVLESFWVRSGSTSAHPEGIARCETSAIAHILPFNYHDSQRTESGLIERLQHLWKSLIKCPVTDQMAVALVFRGASFCSIRRSSDKTENRQKGCCGK